ncbi:MAG: hypothetical protein SWQ30_17455, partial [Thermodesulfobacteriota bacterium]|nr:hypothetical protein [Thermodesulfobacteriota bacterium]
DDGPTNQWRSENVTYTVTHSTGSDPVVVDQTPLGEGGGQWNLLGTYTFDVGALGFVTLTDDVTPAPEPGGITYVIADAIRWELQP